MSQDSKRGVRCEMQNCHLLTDITGEELLFIALNINELLPEMCRQLHSASVRLLLLIDMSVGKVFKARKTDFNM